MVTAQEGEEQEEREQEAGRAASDSLVCSACRLTFGHLAEHRLDLHRYNLKVGLRGRPSLTEGEFEGILEQLEGDKEEEIRCSEEEEEEAEEEGVSVMTRPGVAAWCWKRLMAGWWLCTAASWPLGGTCRAGRSCGRPCSACRAAPPGPSSCSAAATSLYSSLRQVLDDKDPEMLALFEIYPDTGLIKTKRSFDREECESRPCSRRCPTAGCGGMRPAGGRCRWRPPS